MDENENLIMQLCSTVPEKFLHSQNILKDLLPIA